MAFTVLMVALIPLSYLFTTAIESAGQSANQQTALSIAERWTEVLSNATPPVNSYGEVAVDTQDYPHAPAPSAATTTAAGSSVGKNLNAVSSITVASAANFAAATTTVPQTVQVTTGTTSPITTSVNYTAIAGNTLTCASSPCSPTSAVMSSSTSDPIAQSTIATPSETRGGTAYALKAKYSWATAQSSATGTTPDLCTSGTPQLLKLTMYVSWGPNADANNVQDSVLLNYPPAGVQTLGFIALQMSGDTTASDTQNPSAPWTSRVQAIPVTISGQQPAFTLYPDSYGCVFAQVQPGSYTVAVGQPSSGFPSGTTYGNPVFVANATGVVTNHVLAPTTSEPQPPGSPNPSPLPSVTVGIGAVTRVQSVLTNNYPGFDQASVVNLTYPTSTAVEDGVSCPGVGQIVCLASGQNSSASAALTWLNQAGGGGKWTGAALPGATSLTRLTSTACAGTTACVGVGYGTSGAVILHATTGSSPTLTADTVPTVLGLAVTSLSQVVCPTATQCVAIGTTGSGTGVAGAVLIGTIGATSDLWVADVVTNATTSLTNLICPSGATGCAAIGTTASGGAPIVVSGPVGVGTWSAGTAPGITLTSLSQLACPSATTCVAVGLGKSGTTTSPIVISGVTGLPGLAGPLSWTADTEPGTTLTSLGSITCPLATKCLVAGTGSVGTQTGALILYGAPSGPLATEFPLDTGATIGSITQVSCPSATACYLIGSSTGGPELFTGTINATATSADSWTSDALPGSVSALNQIVCPAATSCLVNASGTDVNGGPLATLVATTDGTAWNGVSLPSADNALYFDDIDCSSGASGTCAAVGSTLTGSVIVSSTSGPSGTWSDQTPNNLSGNAAAGIPVEINNPGLATPYSNAVTAGRSANANQLTLYPFSSGYGIWAGDCQSEANAFNVSQISTVPGGTSGITSGMVTPTIALGRLSIQVIHKGPAVNQGTPYAGATLSLKTYQPAAGCGSDTYSLQAAGADGLSRTLVPYGTYSLYVNGSGTAYGTVAVGETSATLTVGTVTSVLALPAVVPVSA